MSYEVHKCDIPGNMADLVNETQMNELRLLLQTIKNAGKKVMTRSRDKKVFVSFLSKESI